MASSASLEGFYFKPRIDKELLEAHSEGIICLSGCVSSEFNQMILGGRGANSAEDHFTQAAEVAKWFHGVFGDRYFIEIMNNGVEIQRIGLEGSVEVANQVGIPLVATSDCHYVDPDDWEAQDVMLCINTGRFRTDDKRMRMDGHQYFFVHLSRCTKSFRAFRCGCEKPGNRRHGRYRFGPDKTILPGLQVRRRYRARRLFARIVPVRTQRAVRRQ